MVHARVDVREEVHGGQGSGLYTLGRVCCAMMRKLQWTDVIQAQLLPSLLNFSVVVVKVNRGSEAMW
jgi:hypothetical protein